MADTDSKSTLATEPKKITTGMIFSWIFGVLFILTGVVTLVTSFVAGLLFLIAGLYVLPPLNKKIFKTLGFILPGWTSVIIFLVLITVGGSLTPEVETKKNDEDKKTEVTSNTTNITPEVKQNSTPEVKKEVPSPKDNIPAEYKSALNKATSYANTMNMSKKGIYTQLISEYGEKFSPESAQYAIDNVKADWNKNALEKAKSYQDTMSMSPSAIRSQLVSDYGEKFTPEEADYAIANLNQ